MGNSAASRIFGKKKKDVNIIVVGLYDAGKSTFVQKFSENVTVTRPTIGMEMESASFKNTIITSTDVGGRCYIRPLLRFYYQKMDAVIFMVDSAEIDPEGYTRTQLERVATEEDLKDAPFLVLANKQDLPGAMSIHLIEKELGMTELKKQNNKRAMEVLPASILKGEGMWEALGWIEYQLHLKHVHQAVVKPVEKAVVKPVEKAVSPSLPSFYSSLSSAFKQTLGTVKETLHASHSA